METRLREFIDRHVADVKPIANELYLVDWQYDTTGNESLSERRKALDEAYNRLYADEGRFEDLKSIEAEKIEDPLLRRQMQILHNSYQIRQGPADQIRRMVELVTEIGSIYNHFRGKVDGEALNDNQIKKILRREKNLDLRRKAWEASKQVGAEVADRVLDLIRMRNERARRCGYRDYYDMGLSCKEYKESELFGTLESLKNSTDAPFEAWKRRFDEERSAAFGIRPEDMRPWHYDDPFFQEVPQGPDVNTDRLFETSNIEDLTRRTYHGISMQIDDILEKSDLYPKDGKCQHAYCTMIDREQKDIRVLCNIDRNQHWASTMLHEFGHAVYDKYIDAKLPYVLNSTAHTLSTEAIAMMMDSLATNREWLLEIVGVPSASIGEMDRALEREKVGELIFIRWALVMIHFERDLYRDPERNLNERWWDLVEKFQFVRRPDRRDHPDWASKIHIALAPVYYQNYLYGELVASQLEHYIQKNVGTGRLFQNPELGGYLIEKYFRPGARMDWRETLRNATGEYLNPEYCVKNHLHIA